MSHDTRAYQLTSELNDKAWFFNNTLVKTFYMTLHARAGELLINVSIVIKAHRMVKQSCLHVLVRRYMYKLLDLARLYT